MRAKGHVITLWHIRAFLVAILEFILHIQKKIGIFLVWSRFRVWVIVKHGIGKILHEMSKCYILETNLHNSSQKYRTNKMKCMQSLCDIIIPVNKWSLSRQRRWTLIYMQIVYKLTLVEFTFSTFTRVIFQDLITGQK